MPTTPNKAKPKMESPHLPSIAGGGPRSLYAQKRDGKFVHIDFVATGTTGLICPDCSSELRARKYNSSKTDHFYHLNKEECRYAGETALHILGKEIIATSNTILVPILALHGVKANGFKSQILVEGRWIDAIGYDRYTQVLPLNISAVRLEVFSDGLRPDLIVTDAKDRELFVEILVTHKVDAKKKDALRTRNNPTIEIDLSGLERSASFDDIRDAVLHTAPRTWIHNATIAARAALLIEHENVIQAKKIQEGEAEREKAMKWAGPAVEAWRSSIPLSIALWPISDYSEVANAIRRAGGDKMLASDINIASLILDGSRSPFAVHPSIVKIELFNLIVLKGLKSAEDYYASSGKQFSYIRGKGSLLKLPPRDRFSLSDLVSYTERRGFIKKRLKDAWGSHRAMCLEIEPDFSSANNDIQRMMQSFIDIGCVGKIRPAGSFKNAPPSDFVIARQFLRNTLS